MRLRALPLTILLALGGACGDQWHDASGDRFVKRDSSNDSDGEDTGGPVVPSDLWWSIGAQVNTEDGVPAADRSLFVVTMVIEDLPPDCSVSFEEATIAVEEPPTPDLFVWWNVLLGAYLDDCSETHGDHLPESFHLGIGPMHPGIQAHLPAAGLSHASDTLLGAYITLEGGSELWAYGAAGTYANFDGEGEPIEGGPLPDGTWLIEPVYLLPAS